MTGEEAWRDIPGYEGAYQVSTLARVRSLRRVVTKSDGRTYCVMAKVLRPMVQARTGFHIVVLSDRGRQTRHYVHRLQRDTFGGELDACEEDMRSAAVRQAG